MGLTLVTCRLNLEEGRFQAPLASRSPGINKVAVSPLHGLVAAAGEEGQLECFDVRQDRCAGRLDAAAAAGAVIPLIMLQCMCTCMYMCRKRSFCKRSEACTDGSTGGGGLNPNVL